MKKTLPHKQPGKVTLNGVKPEPHELDIILFYTEQGKDIEVIPASHTPGNKRPDFIIDGIEWEAKSLHTATRKATERVFYRSARQSDSVIMDLRELKNQERVVIKTLEACFKTTRRVRRLDIITMAGNLLKYRK